MGVTPKALTCEASVMGTKILIAGRCGYPGATTITNLSWVQEQKLRSKATKSHKAGQKV